jgi:hypothetical protein
MLKEHLAEKYALENENLGLKETVTMQRHQINQFQSTIEKQLSIIKQTKIEIDSKNLQIAEEMGLLEMERSKLESAKMQLEADIREFNQEKSRVDQQSAQIEHEWVILKLKEAEVTKALADISVAAAQQAVGSSITTAETVISRDRIRNLESKCQDLLASNDQLQSMITGQSTVRLNRVCCLRLMNFRI